MGDKTLKQNDNHTDIVQDSAWCWVIVIGAFLAHVITHGILYSFGILFIALEEKYGGTKAEIALIPSLMSGTLYLVGPLVSALITRYGCRTVTALGAVIGAIGFITSVFANSLYLLYFTLGILTGCGFGFVFLAAIVVVTRHFQKHRSLACGLALSGAGGGAFICSPLIEWLLATFSLSGTLLILAAIVLNCIPCGLLFRSVLSAHSNRAAETGRELEYESVLHETIEVCGDAEQEVHVHYDAKDDYDTFKQDQTEGSEHYSELANMPSKRLGSSEEDNVLQNSNYEAETQSVIVDDNIVIEIVNQNELIEKEVFLHQNTSKQNQETFKPPNRRLPYFARKCPILGRYMSLISRLEPVVFFISQFLFFVGFYLPFIYIPDKARLHGIPERQAVWVASTIGLSSIAGRVILGYVADRPYVNRMVLFKVALIVTGVSTAAGPLLVSLWSLLLYAVVFGISSGISLSLTSVVLVDLVGMDLLPEAFGLNNVFSGVGSLLGPMFAGVLYDVTQSYVAPFLVPGSAMTASGILLIIVTCCTSRNKSIKR